MWKTARGGRLNTVKDALLVNEQLKRFGIKLQRDVDETERVRIAKME